MEKSLGNPIYYGIGKVIRGRYESHKQTYIKDTVISHLEGKSEEVADLIRPELTKKAEKVAVAKTVVEVVTASAAMVGTILLVKKAIDTQKFRNLVSKTQTMPVSTQERLVINGQEYIDYRHFPFTELVDVDMATRIREVIHRHDRWSYDRDPTKSNRERGVPEFTNLVHAFYNKPIEPELVSRLKRIKKGDSHGVWALQLEKVLREHFDQSFGDKRTAAAIGAYDGLKHLIVNRIIEVEQMVLSKSLSGFLDAAFLDRRVLKSV